MKGHLLAAIAVTALLAAGPAAVAEKPASRFISEAALHRLSDLVYGEVLRQAQSKGWRYTPAQIASGYRRHFDEMRLRFIDEGYVILAGEAGA
jgi:hypothetical protein